MESLLHRFLRYIVVDTQSDELSESQPSTGKQLRLLEMLRDELKSMGVEAELDEWGYVMASIPANTEGNIPAIGFIAHVDTSPDASGAGVKPQIVENYDGGDIRTTLLGADDKAGVAEIMDAVQYIVSHPEFRHGKVCVAFTPDEEIGRGVAKFDVAKFGADYAYTMDGGEAGELEFENFNAASASVHIQGRNVHPGYAKDKMKNAILIAQEFNSLLPVGQRPELTGGYDGFLHITGIRGSVEECDFSYIIRDHDAEKFEAKKQELGRCADFINARYGSGTATLTIKDQYRNMREKVEPHYHIVETAVKAMEQAGVKPRIQPIRGGTDGANLSFKGLPCPNIFAGGMNFHGRYEWVTLENMQKASAVILNILRIFAEK